jgi:hypothetical protein
MKREGVRRMPPPASGSTPSASALHAPLTAADAASVTYSVSTASLSGSGWLHLAPTSGCLDVGAASNQEGVYALSPDKFRSASPCRNASPIRITMVGAGGMSPRVVIPPSPPPMVERILMWERR